MFTVRRLVKVENIVVSSISRDLAARSMILDMRDRLETGR